MAGGRGGIPGIKNITKMFLNSPCQLLNAFKNMHAAC